jgi:hypothetical protein
LTQIRLKTGTANGREWPRGGLQDFSINWVVGRGSTEPFGSRRRDASPVHSRTAPRSVAPPGKGLDSRISLSTLNLQLSTPAVINLENMKTGKGTGEEAPPVGMDRWAVPAFPSEAKERGRCWSASRIDPLRRQPWEGAPAECAEIAEGETGGCRREAFLSAAALCRFGARVLLVGATYTPRPGRRDQKRSTRRVIRRLNRLAQIFFLGPGVEGKVWQRA